MNIRVLITVSMALAINLIGVLVAHADCTPPPSGMIGWWKGDGSAVDAVAGNNGTLVNAGYTNGVVGQAFAFDPENYSYGTYCAVQIADQPAYALTNSLTIEGWVRPRGDGYLIFFRGDHRPGLDPYFLGMQGNNLCTFVITDQNGNSASVQTPLIYNQWTHLAATLDGSTGIVSIYTNSVLAGQTNTTIRPFGALDPTQSPGIGIGNVNDGGNNFPFLGDIDEIALYSRALSLSEIQSIYNAGSAGKCDFLTSPIITTEPSSQTITAAGNVNLSVGVAGIGPINYQWTFNGVDISGATNATLSLINLHTTQSGNYAVKVTSPNGTTTSAPALVTVMAENILIYNYSGLEKITAISNEFSYGYNGDMFFLPGLTNFVFVGWAKINGAMQYWVSPVSDYLVLTIGGNKNHVYTIIGKANSEYDTNNLPHLWSYLHKGLNASLLIGTRKNYSFPTTFTSADTHISPDPAGDLILREANSSYTFDQHDTQVANDTGKTITDLVTSLTNTLTKLKYRVQ